MILATMSVAQAPSSFRDKSMAPASQVTPADLKDIGIDQHLNQPVPLDLQFKDESGNTVKLGDYFHAGRPVILNLVYYTCPMLCGEELAGESSALSMLKFTPGNEYEAVSVSFNPDETPKDAPQRGKRYIARINEHLEPKTDGSGWHFLTGEPPQIRQLADAVGFHYRRDPQTKQFIHATAIMIVTPAGKIAQYYYGVEFSPKDIRLGLDRGIARQHRERGRPGAAVLLSLRPEDRPIRRGSHQHYSYGRSGHHADPGRISHCDVPPR